MAIKRVYIEITNICNLKCAFCAGNHRTQQFMSLKNFERTIAQIKQITDYIYLHVQGEPLLHPQFNEILDLCDQYCMKVQLVTNGTLLERYPLLIEHSCLRKISISLQSSDYHVIEKTDDYMSQIISLCRKASAQNHPFCELRFWISNKPLPKASAHCLDWLKTNYTFIESGRKKNFRIMPNVYVDFAEEFEWPSEFLANCGDSGTCHGAIDQIAVLVDGSVVPCCLDAEGQITFGNLFETPINEILSSERYIRITEGFRKHRIIEALCLHCSYRLRFNRASK